MRVPIVRHLFATVLGLGVLVTGGAAAQNIVPFNHFNTNADFTGGWSTTPLLPGISTGVANWDSTHGATGPLGSAFINNLTVGLAGSQWGLLSGSPGTTCYDVSASVIWSWGGMFFVPVQSNQTGGGQVNIIWYSDPLCTPAFSLGVLSSPTTILLNSWQASVQIGVLKPGGANSAQVNVMIKKDQATGELQAYADDIFFGPGQFPVSLQTFSAE